MNTSWADTSDAAALMLASCDDMAAVEVVLTSLLQPGRTTELARLLTCALILGGQLATREALADVERTERPSVIEYLAAVAGEAHRQPALPRPGEGAS